MKRAIYFLSLLVVTQSHAQSNIKIGKKAPAIGITDWIANVPPNKSLEGKKIVLEFWATWCGPCIAAVPHLNKLQSKYKNSNLLFLSITDESVEKVNRIMKRVDFHSAVASDQSKGTQIAFGNGKTGLDMFPFTVLIDEHGITRWFGRPDDLNDTIMNNFLASKNSPVTLKVITLTNVSQETDDIADGKIPDLMTDNDILCHFEFRKSKNGKYGFTKAGNTFYAYTNFDFIDLYSDFFNIDKKNIEMPEKLSQEKFDMVYKNVKGKDEYLSKFDNDILKALELQKVVEKKTVTALSFSVSKSSLLEKAIDTLFSSRSRAGDKMIFTSCTVPDLIRDLNIYSTERLFFEDEYKGKFDFTIDIKSTDALLNSLKSYGLAAHQENKNIEIIKLMPKK